MTWCVSYNPSCGNLTYDRCVLTKTHTHTQWYSKYLLCASSHDLFIEHQKGELCCGQIGPIYNDSCLKGLIQAIGPINQFHIVDGAGGGYHSIFLSSDHRVFSVGLNSSNQCGISLSRTTTTNNPTNLTNNDNIDNNIDSNGNGTTTTTTSDGTISSQSESGNNHDEEEHECISIPCEIPPEHFDHHVVIRVGASNSHSVFLTKSHLVYIAGANSNGSKLSLVYYLRRRQNNVHFYPSLELY